MSALLDPYMYDGETLCPRCGSGLQTGKSYRICYEPEVTHQESCERYNYSDSELCDECEMWGPL